MRCNAPEPRQRPSEPGAAERPEGLPKKGLASTECRAEVYLSLAPARPGGRRCHELPLSFPWLAVCPFVLAAGAALCRPHAADVGGGLAAAALSSPVPHLGR